MSVIVMTCPETEFLPFVVYGCSFKLIPSAGRFLANRSGGTLTGIDRKASLAKQEIPVAADYAVIILLQIIGKGFVAALDRTGGVCEYDHLGDTVHGLLPLGLCYFNLFEDTLQFAVVSEKIVIVCFRIWSCGRSVIHCCAPLKSKELSRTARSSVNYRS